MKRYLFSATAVLMAAMMFATPALADEAKSKYFIDMDSQSYGFWAIDEVDELYKKKVVSGIGNGLYAPEAATERGDFVLMLENYFHYPKILENKYNFYDVKQGDYYFTAVNNARGNGITEDTPLFNPQTPITRLDAFKMIYNTLVLYSSVGSNGSSDVSMYSDCSALNIKDKIAVATLTKMGIVNGFNGELRPNDKITRADMAVLVSKAIAVYEANGSNPANTGEVQTKKPVLTGVETDPDETRKSKNETITTPYEVSGGDTADIDNAKINVTDGDAVTAKDDGTSLTISDSQISASKAGSKLVAVLGGAEAEIEDSELNASAKENTGVYIDADSEAEINSTKIFARYENGRAVENYGQLTVTDSTLQSVKSEAVKVYSGSSTDISGSDIITEGNNSCIVVANSGSNYDTVTLNLSDVEFKGGKKGSAIMVNNAKVVINLKNVILNGIENLIDTRSDYSKGMKDTDIEINLDNQKFKGEISADDRTNLTLNLTNGSTFTGVINYSNAAKSVNVHMSKDSLLELEDNCYVDAFVVDDEDMRRDRNFAEIIDDNGATIYYNNDNHANDYLDDGTYSLQNGGQLKPMHDPS